MSIKTKIKSFGRLLYQFGWADGSELWWMDNAKDSVRHWVLLHIAVVEKEEFKGVSIIVGKAYVVFSFV